MKLLSYATGLVVLALTTSCGGGLAGVGGGGLGGDCDADFGTNEAALKLEAFLAATNEFTTAATEIETSLTDTCKDMGSTLGIAASEMEGGVQGACNAVAAKIQAEISDLRANANLEIAVVAEPPVCEVSVNAYASCVGECDVNVDPGSADIQCEGGELRGECSAECTGSCSVQASASCEGSCEGTCSAGCSGTCNGACDGTCSAEGPNGECAGRCEGACNGTCEGGCSGSCDGQCVVEASGSCEGECRGGCSVEFQEPRCTGELRPPSASADCQAACDARLEANASCRPGRVAVTIRGGIEGDERVMRLKNALESGLPAILALKAQLERMARAGGEIVSRVGDLPDAVASIGVSAAACASAAASALPEATASVGVSVEVSASVSGSATAG